MIWAMNFLRGCTHRPLPPGRCSLATTSNIDVYYCSNTRALCRSLHLFLSLSWLQQKRRCLLLSITNRETLQGSCSPVSKKQFRTVCQCCIVHKSLRSRYSWSPESKISFTLSSSSSSLPLFLFILFVPLIVFLFLSQRARARARAPARPPVGLDGEG